MRPSSFSYASQLTRVLKTLWQSCISAERASAKMCNDFNATVSMRSPADRDRALSFEDPSLPWVGLGSRTRLLKIAQGHIHLKRDQRGIA